ncbi:sulfatase family protein [Luteolibacter soli]|uniref:Sulfatase n=1 Tax=Luteolibacter soli TaxID=3135280 RepID=A0ABU9B1B6_9BACT
MTKTTTQADKWWRWLKGTAAGSGLWLAALFLWSLWALASSTEQMDNKFSQIARSEHLSFMIGQNLLVLLGYLILWVAAILVLLPAVATLRKRFPSSRRGAALIPAFLMGMAIHSYFILRMAYKRPYFLSEGDYGHWYFRIPELWPVAVRPYINGALFTVLPGLVAVAVVVWWLRRMGPRVRWSFVSAALIFTAVAFLWPHEKGSAVVKPVAEGKQLPNIIIIGSDSLRGDRVGYSGYQPERKNGPAAAEGVSPKIDAWAKDAVRFERCFTPIASTLESSVSMLSSSYPHSHGLRHMFPTRKQIEDARGRIRTLPDVLAESGYDTAVLGDWCANYSTQMPLGFQDVSVSSYDNFRMYISQAVLLAHSVVPLYFDNAVGYRIFPQISSFARFVTPDVVTTRVEDKLAAQAASGRPFFWHVFYSCNHLPYSCGQPYTRYFTDPAYSGKNKTQVDFDINKFVSGTDMEDKLKALPPEDIRQIRALYDGCTRHFDDCFARIHAALEKNGLAKNTIIVVTADHGDDLYEPGVALTHGLGFNGGDHCSHLPLAIAGPGISSKSVPEQIRTIDLAPTLLDLVGIGKPANWEGHSLAGWMSGKDAPLDLPFYGETSFPYILFRVPGVERPPILPMDEMVTIDRDYDYHFVLPEKWDDAVVSSKQRVLRTRHWKVVATPTKSGDRHYGLFHLDTDPDCRSDLSSGRPEVLEVMKAALDSWIDKHVETPIQGIFPNGEPQG